MIHREIKRYNNRRLYDFHDCRYTTLRELRAQVRRGDTFTARDIEGKLITAAVAMEMLAEMARGKPNSPWLLREAVKTLRAA